MATVLNEAIRIIGQSLEQSELLPKNWTGGISGF